MQKKKPFRGRFSLGWVPVWRMYDPSSYTCIKCPCVNRKSYQTAFFSTDRWAHERSYFQKISLHSRQTKLMNFTINIKRSESWPRKGMAAQRSYKLQPVGMLGAYVEFITGGYSQNCPRCVWTFLHPPSYPTPSVLGWFFFCSQWAFCRHWQASVFS